MFLKKIATHSINIIFGVLITFICYTLLQYHNGSLDQINNAPVQNLIVFISIIIILFIVLNLHQKDKLVLTWDHKTVIKLILISSLFIFFIQLIIAYQIYFYTGWDASAVRNAAFYFIEHPEKIKEYFNYYYSYHTNQTTITLIIGTIMKVFHTMGFANFYFGTVVFSILSVNLSGLFISLSLNRLFKNKMIVFIGLFLFTILCSLSPWITIPYSDTYMMIFPALAFYIYLGLTSNKWDSLRWLGILFCIFIGALIKPQSFIMGIAIVLYELILKRKSTLYLEVNRLVTIVVIGLISFFITNTIHKTLINLGQFDQNPELAFTLPHYMMVGFNIEGYGTYTSEDAEISYGLFTIEEREAKNWELINERIHTLNQNGWSDFLINKSVINFGDGSFAWGMEGDFYQKIFERNDKISIILRDYYYHDGEYFDYFLLIKQLVWISVIVLMFAQIGVRKKEDEMYLLYIICIGIILFNMLFEARARYLFAYVPYFIIVACYSIEKLSHFELNVKLKRLINKSA